MPHRSRNKERYFALALSLLLCLSLFSCGKFVSVAHVSPTEAPAATPEDTPEPVEDTPAPSDAAAPTAAPATPEPTAVPTPTVKPTPSPTPDVPDEVKNGRILLYGEFHGNDLHLQRELELWQACYQKGMRDLFIEYSLSEGEYLNRWMQADSDEILEQLFAEWHRTLRYTSLAWDFYKSIKETCPETVFHGVDICVDSDVGWRYVNLLESEGKKDTPEYARARENLKQGRAYTTKHVDYEADRYRDECMAENFALTFDALGGRDVMGIFGLFHVNWEGICKPYPEYLTMLDHLAVRYPGAIEVKEYPPEKDAILLGDKAYVAEYGGLTRSFYGKGYYWAFWRVADAYEDFKNSPLTGETIQSDIFPFFDVSEHQVYVVAIFLFQEDDTWTYMYLRTDGNKKDGNLMAEVFIP